MAAGAKATVTQPDKTVSALPSFVDPDIFFYRKDIFQQKGLTPPKTLAEMESLAQKLHNPPSLYGFVARGLKNANAPALARTSFTMGGDYLTPDRKVRPQLAGLGQGLGVLFWDAQALSPLRAW